MSTVNGFQVGSETLKYNYESLDNYNTPNFSTSSSETYAVGDYVMYNGKLYKCTTATTGGTWVSDNWTEAVLSDDVSDLTRQISDVEAVIYQDAELMLFNYPTIHWAVSISNIWNPNGKSKNIFAADISGKRITVKSNATNGSVVCLLKSIPDTYTYGTPVDYATGASRTFIPAGTDKEFELPDDCVYINVLDNWSDDYLPQYIKYDVSIVNQIESQIMSGDKIGLTVESGWTDYACIMSTHYTSNSGNIQGKIDTNSTYNLSASSFIPVTTALDS